MMEDEETTMQTKFYPTLVGGPQTKAARRSELVFHVEQLEVNDADEEAVMVALFEQLDDLAHGSTSDNDREALLMMLATGGIRWYRGRYDAEQFAHRAANHFMRTITLDQDGDDFLLTIDS